MTTSLAQLRNSIITSIYGRRLGLDSAEFLVGHKSLRHVTQTLSSGSTGTNILNYGFTALGQTTLGVTTGASVGTTEVGGNYLMDAPAEGVNKTIYTNTSHSTALISVEFGTGVTAINTSLGSTFTGCSFNAPGQFCNLVGVSTSKWLVKGASTGTSFASSN